MAGSIASAACVVHAPRAVVVFVLLLLLGMTPRNAAAGMTAADRAIVAAFQGAAPAMRHVGIVSRRRASTGLDVVLAIGSGDTVSAGDQHRYRWLVEDRLGLFFQDRLNASRTTTVAIEPGPNNDCSARVERFTSRELVVSCTGEKSAVYQNQKFLYDPSSRALVLHFAYPPSWVSQVMDHRGPQLVMSDGERVLLVDVDPRTDVPRVVPRSEARVVWSRPPMPESNPGSLRFYAPAPPPEPVSSFGPEKMFRLAEAKNKYGSEYPVVIERRGSRGRTYRLPQSGFDAWRAARPEEAKAGLHPDTAEMNEQIGPHQLDGDRLWFGKTFYNGEGMSGVGGFGYFDTLTRSYKLYAPAEVRRWAASAILVEPQSVWLALLRRQEYGNTPGGLLRWDRRTEHTERFETTAAVSWIARAGDALVLGGDEILVLKGNALRSHLVDRTADGGYRVAAREGAAP